MPEKSDKRSSTNNRQERRRAATADCATLEEQCHPRKIFIGGLAHKTTTQHLRDYFGRYGAIVDAVVLRWPDGRSRGFGYVTFADMAGSNAALEEAHQVGGRQVDVKRAVPGTNKLFVGGLPQNATAAELREHFEVYGVVSDAVVMIDPTTSRSRGFGFVCFLPGQEGAAAVGASLAEYENHRIRGKWIEVKSAAPPHKLVKDGECSTVGPSSGMTTPNDATRSFSKESVATAASSFSVASTKSILATTTRKDSKGSSAPLAYEPQKVIFTGLGAAPPPGLSSSGVMAPAGLALPPGLEPALHPKDFLPLSHMMMHSCNVHWPPATAAAAAAAAASLPWPLTPSMSPLSASDVESFHPGTPFFDVTPTRFFSSSDDLQKSLQEFIRLRAADFGKAQESYEGDGHVPADVYQEQNLPGQVEA